MREFRTIELREALSLRKIADSGQCFRPGEIGDQTRLVHHPAGLRRGGLLRRGNLGEGLDPLL